MHRFKHALVRALAWTIASPDMMDETCGLPVKTAALVKSEFTHGFIQLVFYFLLEFLLFDFLFEGEHRGGISDEVCEKRDEFALEFVNVLLFLVLFD